MKLGDKRIKEELTTSDLSDSSDLLTLLDVYPVGSIYISTASTDPGTLFGGTWSAFGAGRTLIGLDSGDADFDTSEETGGAKTHTHSVTSNVTIGNESAHTHSVTSNVTVDDHTTHEVEALAINPQAVVADGDNIHSVTNNAVTSGAGSAHTHTPTNNAVTSGDNSAIPMKYIVVYFFKRTA